jgi:hypothetical protein
MTMSAAAGMSGRSAPAREGMEWVTCDQTTLGASPLLLSFSDAGPRARGATYNGPASEKLNNSRHVLATRLVSQNAPHS